MCPEPGVEPRSVSLLSEAGWCQWPGRHSHRLCLCSLQTPGGSTGSVRGSGGPGAVLCSHQGKVQQGADTIRMMGKLCLCGDMSWRWYVTLTAHCAGHTKKLTPPECFYNVFVSIRERPEKWVRVVIASQSTVRVITGEREKIKKLIFILNQHWVTPIGPGEAVNMLSWLLVWGWGSSQSWHHNIRASDHDQALHQWPHQQRLQVGERYKDNLSWWKQWHLNFPIILRSMINPVQFFWMEKRRKEFVYVLSLSELHKLFILWK